MKPDLYFWLAISGVVFVMSCITACSQLQKENNHENFFWNLVFALSVWSGIALPLVTIALAIKEVL